LGNVEERVVREGYQKKFKKFRMMSNGIFSWTWGRNRVHKSIFRQHKDSTSLPAPISCISFKLRPFVATTVPTFSDIPAQGVSDRHGEPDSLLKHEYLGYSASPDSSS
jgi:hypothetical protein